MDGMTYYAISDIHGCLNELKAAMEHVRYIRDLQHRYGPQKVIALRGNHEEGFWEWLDAYGGPQAGESDKYGLTPWNDWLDHDEDFQTFQTLITPEQWAFFQKVLPTLSEDSINIEAARMILATDPELVAWP